jgi:periplasmic protein CpxP/Spy
VKSMKYMLSAAVLAAALGGAGIATIPAQHAIAQTANPAPQAQPQRPPRPPRASHIEGRVAFMKAELKITPAQEAQWTKVAQALRQNDQERRQSMEQRRASPPGQPRTALQHLETRARFATVQAQQTDRFLAAFRPLYDGMSPDQKKAADDLMTPHRGMHRRPM